MRKAIVVFCLFIIAIQVQAQTNARSVLVTTGDGKTVSGTLKSLNNDSISVMSGDVQITINLDNITRIEFGVLTDDKGSESKISSSTSISASDDEEKKNEEKGIRAFSKLESSVSSGATYAEYHRYLIEAGADLNDALISINSETVKQNLREALKDFQIASDAWNIGIHDPLGAVGSKSDVGREAIERYGLNIKPGTFRQLHYKDMVRIAWGHAAGRLDVARTALKRFVDSQGK